MPPRPGLAKVVEMTYGSSGAAIKYSLTELVRAGCRVERIGHDPPAVTFVGADGTRSALRLDGRACLLDGEKGVARFHSLDAALAAAANRPGARAS
jgi:hypothetical protein